MKKPGPNGLIDSGKLSTMTASAFWMFWVNAWDDICGSAQVASQWADEMVPVVQESWGETKQGVFSYFRGTAACLSCLLAAERYEELLELIESAPRMSWHNRKYGFRALVAMGQKGKAIKYAKASCGLNDNPAEIDRVCEEILLSSGLYDKAYQQYGLAANLKIHTQDSSPLD